jgi:hypothetical protein
VIKKHIEAPAPVAKQAERAQQKLAIGVWLVALCSMVALILCVLFMASPLQRLAGTPASAPMPGGNLLVNAGSWLPKSLHISKNPYLNQLGTGNVEFLLLMVLAFGIYGAAALVITMMLRRSEQRRLEQRSIMPLIWPGAIIAGLIFVFTPALLSHDVFVYAGYGRLIDVYHANPYFVPFSVYHHDPLAPLDDWRAYVSAYGPLWIGVSSLVAFVAATNPLRYILLFRLIELAAHLVNIQLVILILRKMQRSPRVVTIGALLYAWNPLLLLESSQGGHNDIFMLTFVLLGVLLMVRASARSPIGPRVGILPVVMFTLAALVKYTTAPLVVLAIIALALRSLQADASMSGRREQLKLYASRWRPALLVGLTGCLSCGLVILACYGPFFVGHSLPAIVKSFTSPPSSQMAHKSMLDGIVQTFILNPNLPHSGFYGLLRRLNNIMLWDAINAVTLVGGIIIGAAWLWHRPTTRTFALASLLTLEAFLLVAPWLLPWYATWLVALAVICLPVKGQPIARGLVAFALTFSLTIFILYLYNGLPPANDWGLQSCLLTFGPPILAFLIAILPWPQARRAAGEAIETT